VVHLIQVSISNGFRDTGPLSILGSLP